MAFNILWQVSHPDWLSADVTLATYAHADDRDLMADSERKLSFSWDKLLEYLASFSYHVLRKNSGLHYTQKIYQSGF